MPFEGLSFVMTMLGVGLRKLMLAYSWGDTTFFCFDNPVIINDDHSLFQAYNHTSLALKIMNIFEMCSSKKYPYLPHWRDFS